MTECQSQFIADLELAMNRVFDEVGLSLITYFLGREQMKSLEEATKSLARVTFTDEQRARSETVWKAAADFLKVMWDNAMPSPELTLATRALEESTMWHSKAISNEGKNV